MCNVEVTKRSYTTFQGSTIRAIRPGELYSGRDVTPRGNPFRKVVLATPQGIVSFNVEDVVVQSC